MKNLIQRQTNLTTHVIQFSRFLRANSFDIGPNEEIDLLKAYERHIPISFQEQENLYKAIFVKNRKQYVLFGDLYSQYWDELSRAEDSKTKDLEEEKQEYDKIKLAKNEQFEVQECSALTQFQLKQSFDFAFEKVCRERLILVDSQ